MSSGALKLSQGNNIQRHRQHLRLVTQCLKTTLNAMLQHSPRRYTRCVYAFYYQVRSSLISYIMPTVQLLRLIAHEA